MTSRGSAGEHGAATVLVVAMTGVLLSVGVAVSAGAGLVVAHRQAQAAADLAALAAAGAPRRGDDPCRAAREIAQRNGARLAACQQQGADVVVRATVRSHFGGPWAVDLVGEARAGPDRSGR